MLAGTLLNLPQPKAGKRNYKTLAHKEIARLGEICFCDETSVLFEKAPVQATIGDSQELLDLMFALILMDEE